MTERYQVGDFQRTLIITITIPDDICPGSDDPDEMADEIVLILNESRTNTEAARRILAGDPCLDGVQVEPIMVSAIPSPELLTAHTLQMLRIVTSINLTDIYSLLTAYDYHVPRENRGPWRDRIDAALAIR